MSQPNRLKRRRGAQESLVCTDGSTSNREIADPLAPIQCITLRFLVQEQLVLDSLESRAF